MKQEDYIKRQIEQLGRALGKILSDLTRLKSKGETGEGSAEASQALKTKLGLNFDNQIMIPTESFLSEF